MFRLIRLVTKEFSFFNTEECFRNNKFSAICRIITVQTIFSKTFSFTYDRNLKPFCALPFVIIQTPKIFSFNGDVYRPKRNVS